MTPSKEIDKTMITDPKKMGIYNCQCIWNNPIKEV